MIAEPSNLLLIVDDERSVCRAVSRMMKKKVDQIVMAQTVTDAELVLDTKPVTHVLCDHLLAPGEPRGMDVASRWKARYPSIRRVVILTGTNSVTRPLPEGIDEVIPKTIDPNLIAEVLAL